MLLSLFGVIKIFKAIQTDVKMWNTCSAAMGLAQAVVLRPSLEILKPKLSHVGCSLVPENW